MSGAVLKPASRGFSCLLLVALLLSGGNLWAQDPDVKATQKDTYPSQPGNAQEGETITYETIISNVTGTGDATGVKFKNLAPANTTDVAGSVTISPLAFPDTYSTNEGTAFSVLAPAGLLANDTGQPLPSAVPIAAVAIPPGNTTAGGSVGLAADGSFSYTPPTVGFQGTDTFTYTVTNANSPNDTATVTIVADNAPTVTSTIPLDNAATVPAISNITITFSEPVNVTGNWFKIEGSVSGVHSASVSGGPTSWTLNPDTDFSVETVTVTVFADKVTDQDSFDPPDNMAADHSFDFTVPPNSAPVITESSPAAVTMDEDGSPTAFSLTLNATDADNDTITWSISSAATNGTATATGTGASKAIGYTPNANFNGSDSFTVQVADGNGGTDTIVVNVTIDPVNDAPAITDSKPAAVTMDEDGSPTAFSLTLNATDADTDTITWSISSAATNGTATATGTGTSKAIGYTPNANYNGSDSFTVQVSDGNGGTDTIVVNVTIDAVNDTPAITDSKPAAVTMDEDGSPTAFSLTLNAADADTDTITWSISSAATNGTATATGTGASKAIGYTPNANFNGSDSFTVQVADGNGGTDTIVVNVTIDPVNDAPAITDSKPAAVTMDEDGSPTAFSLTLNATDADTDTITWSISSAATNGTATATGTGTSKAIGYTPNANYNGSDSFTVQVADGNGGTDTIVVNVTIDPVNDAPAITDSKPAAVTMDEDGSPTAFSLTLNATDADTDTITWSISSAATNGTATATGTGASKAIGYTPNANFNGSDSFTVQVSDGNGGTDTIVVNVTIDPVNDAPAITDSKPAAVTMSEDSSPDAFSLTLNATDVEGNTLTWSISSPAGNGTATATGTGTSKAIGYTPNANYNGSDSFTVQVADGNGGTDTIVVNVTIDAVNDTPAITDSKPAAVTMDEDGSPTAFSLTLNAADADTDTITWSISGAATNGTATATGTGTSKAIGYTPNANFNGNDSFTVQISDGNGGTDTIVVNVTINAIADAPVITDTKPAAVTMDEDGTPTAFDLTLNATDAEGDTITWSISSAAGHGTATATGTGTSKAIGYTPDADFNGSDSFTVQVADGNGGTDTIIVNVTINSINDAPLLTAGAVLSYTENAGATVIDNTINLTDVDDANMDSATVQITGNYVNGHDVLSFSTQNGISGVFNAATGTMTLTGSATKAFYQTALRSVMYHNTSNDPSTLARTVTWIVNDGGPANPTSAPVTSTINVTAVNDPPTANGFAGLPAQAAIPITYPAGKLGGTDVEAGTTITIDTTPINVTNGTAALNANGSFTFTPLPNATTASFQYRVSDNGNPAPGVNSAYATVSFTVAGPAIYFVKNPAVGSGNCTLGNECLLATAVTNIGAATNARIFIADANTHTGPATLNSDGWLIGQGVTANFDTLFGIGAPAQGTLAARPATKGSDNTITNPTITTAAASTNGVNLGGNNTVRGLTVGNTTGTKIFGSNFGTLTIGNNTAPDVTLNGSGKALDLATGTFANTSALSSVTTTSSGTQGINLVSVTGPVAFGGTTVADSTSTGISVATSSADINFGNTSVTSSGGTGVSLSNNTGDMTFADLDISPDSTQRGLLVSNTVAGVPGTITTTSGTISALLANAVEIVGFNSTTNRHPLAMVLDSVSSTGGTNNILLTNISGSLAMNSGALSLSTGVAFNVSGSNATVSYAGSITNVTGGISLTNNTGGTISFTGGMNLSTGTNAAFTATGGGTVSATQNNSSIVNTLTTTTGTALNVTNTSIGMNGLTFRSINSPTSSANIGIILENTGSLGGLTVTGIGTTAGSGGTISNKTGGNLTSGAGTPLPLTATRAGTGIFLKDTASVSISNMLLQNFTNFGIFGRTVNGFTLAGTTINTTSGQNGNDVNQDEGSMAFDDLTGTVSITNCSIEDGQEANAKIVNRNGTLNLTVAGSTFKDTTPNVVGLQGLLLVSGSSAGDVANITANITNCTFTNNFARGIQAVHNHGGTMEVNIGTSTASSGGTFDNNFAGVDIAHNGSGPTNFNVKNATFSDDPLNVGPHINIFMGSGSTAGSTFQGRVHGNVVTGSNNQCCAGIAVVGSGAGTMTIAITNNNVSNIAQRGISVAAGQGSNTVNATITGNTVTLTDINSAEAIFATASVNPADTSTMNATIGGSTAALKNNVSSVGGAEVRVEARFGRTFVLPGYGGGAQDTAAVNAFTAGNNTINGGTTSSTVGLAPMGQFLGNPATPQPGNSNPLLAAPGGIEAAPELAKTDSSERSPSGFTSVVTDSVSLEKDKTVARDSSVLSQRELDRIVAEAISRWSASGLRHDQLTTLRSLKFEVADLQGLRLGEADGHHIRLDNNAGGNGWFIDANTDSDTSFAKETSLTRHYTDPSNAAAGRIDLLTAVMHEMGHALGLPDSYDAKERDKVMYGFLTKGERRVPAPGEAAGAKPGSLVGPHFLDAPGDTVTIPTIPAGKSVTVRFKVKIDNPVSPSTASPISSQGTVSGTNFTTVNGISTSLPNTDDPDDATSSSDPTLTHVDIPPRAFSTGGPVANGTLDQAYTGHTFVADGNPAPTYTIFSGSLPPGMSLSSAGLLSGTPTQVGVFSNIVVRATNAAGSFDETFSIQIDKGTTTTAITSANPASPSTFGEAVTFTATVTPNFAGALQPTGTVTFKDGATTLGSGTLADVGGTATATYTTGTTQLPVGSRQITAVYSNDANFSASTSAISPHTVALDGTTTSVASSVNPSVFGENVTFKATVAADTAGAGTPTGTVQFVIDGSDVGSPVTLSGGVAEIDIATLSVSGSPHIVKAEYSGSTNFGSSDGSLTVDQVVNPADSTTAVTSSANPSVSGQSVTFTATVAAASPGSGTPTGTVQFLIDGFNVGGPVTLSGGVATLSTSSLSVSGSPHTVKAEYSGSTNFNNSNGSLTVDQAVNKANSTTSVASSVNPSVSGENVTFTATVAAVSPGSGIPTGTVQFVVDGSNVGSPVALSGSGTAQLSTSSLSVSATPHTVKAEYSGSANFNSSDGSLAAGQTVNKPNTTTGVTSSVNPSVFGQDVTFTATVAAVAPGSGTPAGTVQFKIDGTNLGSAVTLVGGSAQISTATLPVSGSPHTVTAEYTGSTTFNGSSGTLGGGGQSVNKANTTTGVTSSGTPTVFGQSVTFTATVAAVAPGSGTPAGTVQFVVDGSNFGAPVTLSGGSAQTSTAALTVSGTAHSVTAQYSGNSSFNSSNGTLAGGQTVSKANTATGVTSSVNPSVFGQNVTFTATVAAVSPGSGTPTGTVQFLIDGSNLGAPVSLSGGTAQASTATLSVTGSPYTVTAKYSGSSSFNSSNGTLAGDQVVNKANTTTAVTSSANPSTPGQNVTFTATVAAVAPGAGTPTGTVQFLRNGSNLGAPVSLSGGVAQRSTSALPPSGSPHTITAQYSGDIRFNSSSGTLPGGQQVNLPSATPTPTPTPTPSPGASPTPTPSATPAQALNISTRLRVDIGDKVMIGGFIIRGNAPKPVLIRGLGPTLVDAGVPAANILNDPKLELRGPNGTALITSNDNWKDSPQKSQIEGTAFEPSDEREAVIVATLAPGDYTAILSGVDQTSGIGLVEIYDTNHALDSYLANISTRGFVQVADEVMIGGFTVGGNNKPTRMVVRALGPSLTNFGLSSVLSDPTLELHNANGTIMVSNDDWQSDSASAAELTANGLALPDPKESGIFTALAPPGQFTAIVAGKDGGIGIALVEIYDLR